MHVPSNTVYNIENLAKMGVAGGLCLARGMYHCKIHRNLPLTYMCDTGVGVGEEEGGCRHVFWCRYYSTVVGLGE